MFSKNHRFFRFVGLGARKFKLQNPPQRAPKAAPNCLNKWKIHENLICSIFVIFLLIFDVFFISLLHLFYRTLPSIATPSFMKASNSWLISLSRSVSLSKCSKPLGRDTKDEWVIGSSLMLSGGADKEGNKIQARSLPVRCACVGSRLSGKDGARPKLSRANSR